ncbi:hypothetical protein BRADI_2g24015v3 [Brachypodium distachyon]|uniref:Uncharacterized protein n=1 Tax=Brachypodium distachyon TaxID=15368 RepID=A0A2K2DA59_BRADI|nr:hypothetical protein BRADI_2g24015v3 [Brachypodium distachyon]
MAHTLRPTVGAQFPLTQATVGFVRDAGFGDTGCCWSTGSSQYSRPSARVIPANVWKHLYRFGIVRNELRHTPYYQLRRTTNASLFYLFQKRCLVVS